MYCSKHPEEETSLSCGRCETPICVRCVVHTDVGIRCRECAPARAGGRSVRRGASLFGVAAVIILLIVVGGSLARGDNPLSSDSHGDDYEEFVEEQQVERITVNEVVDPSVPDGPYYQPAPGHRLVGLSVTIENPESSDTTTYVGPEWFKLTDSDGFAHGPTYSHLRPELRGLELEPGEKTSGWVMFEVDERSTIRSLTYWTTAVALPP